MTAANEQIVSAYEVSGMSIPEIAAELELDELAVKAVLLQNSNVFRKECKKNVELNYNDDEAQEMKAIVLNLARYSEDERLQFRAAQYVLDDKKGRLDNVQMSKNMVNVNVNVMTINSIIQKALAAEQRTIDKIKSAMPVLQLENK